LVVDHVEGEHVAVEGVLVGDRAARIGRDDRVGVDDLVRAAPPDVLVSAVVGVPLRPAAVGE
jgi:hypothetical protein